MIYNNLGKSGLKVSVIGFGTGVNFKPENYEQDKNIVKKCLQAGVNFFDTAQLYGLGESEKTLGTFMFDSGKIFKELNVQRENVIVSTKVWTSHDPQRNSTSNVNRKHVKQALQKSLNRLQMDYVDILFAHGYDQDTPLEEVCRAFHELIEDGKTFYWGTSNWKAEDVFGAFSFCEQHNLHKPICAQNQYSMLVRNVMEFQYQKLFQTYGYGLIAWSPLAGGFLTGKHLDGVSQQQGNRLVGEGGEFSKRFWYTPYESEKTINSIKAVKDYAEKELQATLTEVALAWCIKFKHTSTALIGARKVSQVEQSLNALKVVPKLTPQVEARINKLIGTSPEARMNFNTGKPYQLLRPAQK